MINDSSHLDLIYVRLPRATGDEETEEDAQERLDKEQFNKHATTLLHQLLDKIVDSSGSVWNLGIPST